MSLAQPTHDDRRPRARTYLRGQAVVYLVHFHAPLRHARHYVGHTRNLRGRLYQHRKTADGCAMMRAVRVASIRWSLVRVWSFERVEDAWRWEHYLKSGHGAARLCPRCARAYRARARDHMRKARAAAKALTFSTLSGTVTP